MPPVSASKAKRQAEKAAKAAAKGEKTGSSKDSVSTGSTKGSSSTKGTSVDEEGPITDMKKLAIATERNASGVIVSDKQSRDLHIESFSMSFHGRLLIDNATVALNYGQRYGLLGENGSGKTTFLEALANRDVEIPEHIDIYLVRGEADPSDENALDSVSYTHLTLPTIYSV